MATLAVLADYFVPLYSFRYPYYNLNGAFWPRLRIFAKEKRHELPVHSVPCTVFNFLPRCPILRPATLARCREDFDFSVRQLVQQRFKLHTLGGFSCCFFAVKNLIHGDMVAGHQL